ncbi:hypothetical protein Hanom_Chr08g00683801 [Helianthus anomalus]
MQLKAHLTSAINSSTSVVHRQHHYRASLKKKLKEMTHKVLDTTPSYPRIGNGFQRLPSLPQEIVRATSYNNHKHMSSFSLIEDDIDVNVDEEATDFIESMHKKFEISKEISMKGG